MALVTPREFVNTVTEGKYNENSTLRSVSRVVMSVIKRSTSQTCVVLGEIRCIDNDVSGLMGDVTADQLKLDSTQQGCDLIVCFREMAIKGS